MSKKRSGKRKGSRGSRSQTSQRKEPARAAAAQPSGKPAGKTPGKSSAKTGAGKASAGRKPVTAPIVAMLAIAAAGVALTAYLTGVKLFGATPLACGVGSECDVVQSSRWSTFLGVPIAAWGLLTYALIAGLVWRAGRLRRAWAQAWVLALIGFSISVYLTTVAAIELEAACAWCLASLGLLTALLVGLSALRPAPSREPALRSWVPGSAIAAVAIVVGLHAHYSGLFDPAAGPEKPELVALATHLGESGAVFYGAYWCSHCQEQKALFEASAKRLPYVECTPDGRSGPRSVECLSNNINSYPTWIIGGRRYEQILEPPELARMTGFEWSGEAVAAR